jgi:GGDEF domain-containing protein
MFAVQGGLLLVATVTMYVNRRMNPSLPEAKLWAAAFGWMVVAAFLLSGFMGDLAQPGMAPRLSIITGNACYAVSFLLFHSGARCISDKRPLSWSQILLIVAPLGIAQLVGDFGTDYGAVLRPAISTSALALISAGTGWVVLSATDKMTAPRGLFVGFSVMASLALGLRAVLLILSGFGWVFSGLLTHALPFYALTLMISGYTVAFILLAVHELNVQLRNQAARDPLTGAYNRRAFAEVTLPIIATAKREKALVAVAMFDLDHFKNVNDDHGHTEGDRLLQLFVEVADSTLRAGDVFARYGGEEFVALNDRALRTTVSVSIRFFTKDETLLGPVLRRADRALYQAKEGGRNRYVVGIPE